MSTYSLEVCVGGPMDGERHVAIREFTDNPGGIGLIPLFEPQSGRYVFNNITLESGESVGVWVHESLSTPGEVLRALVEGYRKAST